MGDRFEIVIDTEAFIEVVDEVQFSILSLSIVISVSGLPSQTMKSAKPSAGSIVCVIVYDRGPQADSSYEVVDSK